LLKRIKKSSFYFFFFKKKMRPNSNVTAGWPPFRENFLWENKWWSLFYGYFWLHITAYINCIYTLFTPVSCTCTHTHKVNIQERKMTHAKPQLSFKIKTMYNQELEFIITI
jgi:hypothetical protein